MSSAVTSDAEQAGGGDWGDVGRCFLALALGDRRCGFRYLNFAHATKPSYHGLPVLLPFFSLAYDINGEVVHITDGDTVNVLEAAYHPHKVRLASIDVPARE